MFDQWGVEISQSMAEVKAKKLPEPKILDSNRSVSFKEFVDRKVQHLQPLRLMNEEWAFCYSQRDFDLVNQIVESFRKASPSLDRGAGRLNTEKRRMQGYQKWWKLHFLS